MVSLAVTGSRKEVEVCSKFVSNFESHDFVDFNVCHDSFNLLLERWTTTAKVSPFCLLVFLINNLQRGAAWRGAPQWGTNMTGSGALCMFFFFTGCLFFNNEVFLFLFLGSYHHGNDNEWQHWQRGATMMRDQHWLTPDNDDWTTGPTGDSDGPFPLQVRDWSFFSSFRYKCEWWQRYSITDDGSFPLPVREGFFILLRTVTYMLTVRGFI